MKNGITRVMQIIEEQDSIVIHNVHFNKYLLNILVIVRPEQCDLLPMEQYGKRLSPKRRAGSTTPLTRTQEHLARFSRFIILGV